TNRAFLSAYRRALRPGAEIHFKTDNAPLFEYSLEEFPAAGFAAAEVTRDLHARGPVGIMTDYEAKFYAEGVPICRCVAVLEE
ncbi:MAG: tRNA (guanosine(46)-N7)-methyltransferase TrmB, partial [Clostridia bacterium]|nr:tRNA (guanosine(46)-N7)-methyltransferase TrmB [Clostridia bacterium]